MFSRHEKEEATTKLILHRLSYIYSNLSREKKQAIAIAIRLVGCVEASRQFGTVNVMAVWKFHRYMAEWGRVVEGFRFYVHGLNKLEGAYWKRVIDDDE